jgi:hypothetical protein
MILLALAGGVVAVIARYEEPANQRPPVTVETS